MNYIQQNARDLCAGLREMKWNAFEQQLLTPPDEDNFEYARHNDLPHLVETEEQMLQRLKEETHLLDSARQSKSWATPTCECADCAQPSDLPLAKQANAQDARLMESVARQRRALDPVEHLASLFANEDTTHLPQQVRKQIAFIIGDYYV